jgi:hypothetical protein
MLREVTKAVLAALRDMVRSRAALVAENTLLRQQVIVLHRAAPHPRLKPRDRFTISAITKLFPSLVAAVPIVRPATVIRWHRSWWKLLWRRRSSRPVGRPPIDVDTRALIRRMCEPARIFRRHKLLRGCAHGKSIQVSSRSAGASGPARF